MPFFFRDLRHSVRAALRQPGVTVVVLLTLALGIGANTSIFTLFYEIYWREYEAPEPDRLFFVRSGTRERPNEWASSQPDAAAYREALAEIGDVATWGGFGCVVNVPGQDGSAGLTLYRVGRAVSSEYFDFFGAFRPEAGRRRGLGRGFLPEEDRPGAEPVVVVGHDFWHRHLNADPAILGRTIYVNSIAYTVVGVTPRDFQGNYDPRSIYVPLPRIDDVWPHPIWADPAYRRFISMSRLHEGATREEAAARLAVVGEALDQENPWGDDERKITLLGVDETGGGPETGELMLAGAVGLLLLLASANVANLLLARAAGRRREIAVMAAVGAGTRRIAARLLTESVLLSVAGGALGLGVARWLTAYIKGLLEVRSVGLGILNEGVEWMRYDERVLLYTFGVAVLTGCLFGLAPVAFALRTDLVSALKGTGLEHRQGRRFGARQALVVTQVVLSTVLLLGAGLLVRSLSDLRQRDLGFETEHQLLATLSTAPPRLDSERERHEVQRRLYETARQRLSEIPGVRVATITGEPPAVGFSRTGTVVLPSSPDERLAIDQLTVGRHFFETFDIPLVKGRAFDERDRAGAVGAVIVSRSFVDHYWEGGEALGREMRLPDLGGDAVDDRFVVIGVAADIRHASRLRESKPLVYVTFDQHLWGSRATLVARTSGPPELLMPAAREALSHIHPDLALAELATYDDVTKFDLRAERLYGAVAGLFSLFGLIVACLGIYSVMSCSVSYRVRELGIRMALGARARDVVRLVLREAFGLVAVGVVLGVGASLALARLLTGALHGISAYDPWTYLPLPLALAGVGLAAAWLPAWRAGRVDPKEALTEA